jgi:hypothetical protein
MYICRVKKLFAILIVFGISAQILSRAMILLNFQLNREYIAKNLCVQKEKKNNCCQGSCHLKSQLAEEDKKEKTPAGSKEMKEMQVICEKPSTYQFNLDLSDKYPFSYLAAEPNNFSGSVFHPPSC